MSRYIDADTLQNAMYHEAFETDTEMQRWDSGCWIRYKLFENILNEQPTVDVVEVVRCKDCKYCEHWYADKGRCFLWHESGIDVFEDGFCNYGERRENEQIY